jgi:hypothetical protein
MMFLLGADVFHDLARDQVAGRNALRNDLSVEDDSAGAATESYSGFGIASLPEGGNKTTEAWYDDVTHH